MQNVETEYIEMDLSEVIRYFAKDFTGYRSHKSFVDVSKNTVIFKLTYDKSESEDLLKQTEEEHEDVSR